MISLFAQLKTTIDISKFDHLLHGRVVTTLEEHFASYVGAKYACSINSCTNAIFLLGRHFPKLKFQVPVMIPPVVVNAIYLNGTNKMPEFIDDIEWVGDSYCLAECDDMCVIDSAQQVRPNQYPLETQKESDIILYSFYPTKPIGSIDGGMIVSNDKDIIEFIRTLTMNGAQATKNSWERRYKMPGWKMYMNSTQATIALSNLLEYPRRLKYLEFIRNYYNDKLGYSNTSNHLYRISVTNNDEFMLQAKQAGICCGKHYSLITELEPYKDIPGEFPLSLKEAEHTVSIPFHYELSIEEIEEVVKFVKEHK